LTLEHAQAYNSVDTEHSVSQEDTVLHHAANNPDNKLTKGKLRELAQRVAHGLRHNYGIGANGPNKDVVTVISYGQILVPAALFGVVAAGGVYSAASPSSTVAELKRQVDIGQSRLIICGSEHKDVASKAAQEAGLPPQNVLLLDSEPNAWSLSSLVGNVNAISDQKLPWPKITDPTALRDSLIVILWSSGTTGLPKGVMLSHQNLVAETYITSLSARSWAAKEIAKGTFVPKQQCTLAHLPISHIAGLFGYLIGPVYSAATVIWMRRYVWDDLVRYLKQYKITAWYTVPSIWLRISKSSEISLADLSGLEGVSTGAAPMDGVLMKNVNSKVGTGRDKLIGQTWGLSETTGAVTAAQKDDPRGGDDTGSIGYILPSVELRLVDDNYEDIQDPETQEGELLVRSPLVTRGYFRNEKATQEAFRDGWFCSGDIGILRNGKFYVVDRKKVRRSVLNSETTCS
jgi:4-coumarate--CoA ligase